MRIGEIRTIRIPSRPNLLLLEVATGDGATGIGETFFAPGASERYLHDDLAPALLGTDLDGAAAVLAGLDRGTGGSSTSIEMRARSAMNVALWDLRGKYAGLPLHRLLAEGSPSSISVYNTCAGRDYVQQTTQVASSNWGLESADEARYPDLYGFMNAADRLAVSLLNEKYSGMKIWPFDPPAEETQGQYISRTELARALTPVQKVRSAVGDRIELMIELHGMWSPMMASRIIDALAGYNIRWIEDPVKVSDFGALAKVRQRSPIPIAAGETMAGVDRFRDLIDAEAVDTVIVDPVWCGGVDVAVAVGEMADAAGLEIAFHDCTGPVALAVATHLALARRNARVQEMVRAFYFDWYAELTIGAPALADGRLVASDRAGVGVEIRPEVLRRPDTLIVGSSASGVTSAAARR